MKLNIKGCRRYIRQHDITDYEALATHLGIEVEMLKALEQGAKLGYELLKDIYNRIGEAAVKQIIDFEQETMSGFKSKFVLVGKLLY